MGLWARLFGGERKASSLDLLKLMAPPATKSGQRVDAKTALQVTAVLACVRCLADGVSQVPLKLYRYDEATGSRRTAKDHDLYSLLYARPNEWQTSYEFRETMMFHCALTGNFFAYKNLVGGTLTELVPLEPGRVRVERDPKTGTLSYSVRTESGAVEEFPAELIWHLKGPAWTAWQGLDAVALARDAIGLAMATEEHHGALHKHGARPGGVLSVSGRLSDQEYTRLRTWIDTHYAGSENSFQTMLLDRDAKFSPHAMTGVDSQHLETRRFQIEEICRAFRVMPIMAGYLDKASTYASAEQMFLAHVVYTLAPWYERIEQSIAANLLSDSDRDEGVYPKFTANGLLRGAAADRSAYYSAALGSGGSPAWMTPNEIRALEEMNPIEGGDLLPVATNPATPGAE